MPSFLSRTLGRSRERLTAAFDRLVPGKRVDEEDLDALEEALIGADVGPETADHLLSEMRSDPPESDRARAVLHSTMREVLSGAAGPAPRRGPGPRVVLMVGVNGSGKTTTAAKLAHLLAEAGETVMLAAGDTFRAAAVEQLKTWGKRLDVPVIAHATGGDPAAVAFDACQSAVAREIDVVIIDTAGRLQTHDNLMTELDKIRRVTGRVIDGAPHEVLLVLDGTTGQNGLRQAEAFLRHAGVTGLVLAKLDGTAKGGVALTIARQLHLPIRYVGTGEQLGDLAPFDAAAYVDALIGEATA